MCIKQVFIFSLLCLVVSSCTNQLNIVTATPLPTLAMPELTTDRISGLAIYSALTNRDPFATQIFIKNLDTGTVKQLTDSGNNSWARWSPDGSQIMFNSWSKETLWDISIMDKEGSNQREIVSSSANELLPDWSPDGKNIVYASDEDGSSEIYSMNLETGDVEKLTETDEFANLPTWSTDGSKIAFTSSAGGVGRMQIFLMDKDGENIKQVTDYDISNFDGAPVWCPDDTCLIFRRDGGRIRLVLLDLSNKKEKLLLGNIFDPNLMQVLPGKSPLRGYITFIVGEKSYAMDIKNQKVYSLGITNALDISLYP